MPIESPDGFGGVIRTYAAGPELWGALRTLGKARPAAGGATHQVTLRWREGVDERFRLTLGLRRFRVRAADDPDGRQRDLVCLVEEMAP